MESFEPSHHNVAAWALKKNTRPVLVASAPYNKPEPNQVVIKVKCIAVNPIDWLLQENDIFNLTYPTIFGLDAAGEIHEVGDNVKQLKKGQRVIG